LALSAFNALDLCNCLAGISLFRVHVARTAAPVQGAQVGEELFEKCLEQACTESVMSTLTTIQMTQILEACKLVGCSGHPKLNNLFQALRSHIEAIPELMEAARSGHVPPPASMDTNRKPGDPVVRPPHGPVAEAAVKAFDNDRRSLISTWVIACIVASASDGSDAASELSQLLLPVMTDPGLLSFARRADIMLMLEALQHCPSATIMARLIGRAMQFDQFGSDADATGETEALVFSNVALERFTFREILSRVEKIGLALGPAAAQNPEFGPAIEALRNKVTECQQAAAASGPAEQQAEEEGQAAEDEL